jgi:hypothetical protein
MPVGATFLKKNSYYKVYYIQICPCAQGKIKRAVPDGLPSLFVLSDYPASETLTASVVSAKPSAVIISL